MYRVADKCHASEHAERCWASRAKLAGLVSASLAGSSTDERVEYISETLHSFVLGLIVQAVLDPDAYPPERKTGAS